MLVDGGGRTEKKGVWTGGERSGEKTYLRRTVGRGDDGR